MNLNVFFFFFAFFDNLKNKFIISSFLSKYLLIPLPVFLLDVGKAYFIRNIICRTDIILQIQQNRIHYYTI